MELGTRPDGEPLGRGPGVLIAVVMLNGLVEAPEEEEVHAEDVIHEDEGAKHGSKAEDQGLDGMGIFGSHANGDLELVVHLVDVLVPGSVMEETMDPVEVKVLNEEGKNGSKDDLGPRRQMSIRTNANIGRDEVENEHHRKLEEKMTHQQLLDTLDVALKGVRFVLQKMSKKIKVSFSSSNRTCTHKSSFKP